MHSFQSALAEAFGGKEELEKRLRKARFERAAEHGRELMLNATKATVEGRLKDALTEIRKDRYACAAYIASELSKERKRFVPVRVGFSELELMEQLWEKKSREQEVRGNGLPREAPQGAKWDKPRVRLVAS